MLPIKLISSFLLLFPCRNAKIHSFFSAGFTIFLIGLVVLPLGELAAQPFSPSRSSSGEPAAVTAPTTSGISQSIDPETYLVGPGDMVMVSITSQTYATYQVTITPDSKLLIPRLAEFSVNQLTLSTLRDTLEARLNQFFRKAKVSLTLLSLRNFDIDILGEVALPSKVRVSATDRISDALTRSPALLDGASLRQLKLKRKSPDTLLTLDLFRFYRLTDNRDNLFLKEGDILIVERRIQEKVTVLGEVKYPGDFEFVKGDSLTLLLQFAGGILQETAKTDSIEIIRFTPDRKGTVSLFFSLADLRSLGDVPLERGDVIIVRRLPLLFPESTVEVRGYVYVPGVYRIDEKRTRLLEILQRAGGLRQDGSIEEASLYRSRAIRPEIDITALGERSDLENEEYQYAAARKRELKGRMTVNFRALLDGDTTQNILLEPGDIIDIPYSRRYVNVIGRVLYPGNIPYSPKKSIKDYIKEAGGFGKRALTNEILVLKPNTGDLVDANEVEFIEPSDVILVQEKVKSTFWRDALGVFFQITGVIGAIATTYFVIQNVR